MIIIGEKINGAIPRVAKAISDRDEDWIRHLARIQEDAEVDYIDCCACVREGELETLKWLTDIIQDETDAKISLDSPDPRALVSAMAFCKKPGLINSVSLEGEKAEIIFPAIADTKWNCVCLLCDDKGIPKTAERRIEIFNTLLEKAEKCGIAHNRLFIDPAVEPIGTNNDSLNVFTRVCRGVKELCPDVHLTSGLSNISFGMPVRKVINIGFVVLAMNAGMDSAIIDPTNRDLIGAIYATSALLGQDEFCMDYIGAYRDELFGPVK